MIDPETNTVVCDRCRVDEPGPGEADAEAAGWFVDSSVEAHGRCSPGRKGRAGRRTGMRSLAGAGLASLLAFGAATSSANTTNVQPQAQAICVAALPTIIRLDTDERRAVADNRAGKLSADGLDARYRTDLLAFAALGTHVAAQIAAIPGEHSDAITERLVAGQRRLAGVLRSEGRAAGRHDRTAVKAYAKQANTLMDAGNRLVPGCGAF